jgi:hypothetical protein
MSEDGYSEERVRAIVDDRLAEYAAVGETSTNRLAFPSVTKREFVSALTGGALGAGASAVFPSSSTGGRDSPLGPSQRNDTSEADPETSTRERVVTDGSELQRALDASSLVRVRGELSLSEPVTVPQSTVLYGYGVYRHDTDVLGGDGLRSSHDGPVVDIAGNHTRLSGLAVVNEAPRGDGIRLAGYAARVSYADVFAGRYGIDCSPESETTEPRIGFNRVLSSTGSSASSTGVRIGNTYDSKLFSNIVAGFDVAIDVQRSSSMISLNHVYTYPASASSVGIRVGADAVRVINNRIEGAPTTAGVDVSRGERLSINDNLIQVGVGADGIRLGIDGDLIDTFVSKNFIGGYSPSKAGATAVAGPGITGYRRSVIGPNATFDFENDGIGGVTAAVGSGTTPEPNRYFRYQIVANTDDDSLWVKSTNGMRRIG